MLAKSGVNSIESKSVIIQSYGHLGSTFETLELAGGMYTVTIQEQKDYTFGSKCNWFTVQIIDRTGELTSTAPRVQYSIEEVQVSCKASMTGGKGGKLTMYEETTINGRVIYG